MKRGQTNSGNHICYWKYDGGCKLKAYSWKTNHDTVYQELQVYMRIKFSHLDELFRSTIRKSKPRNGKAYDQRAKSLPEFWRREWPQEPPFSHRRWDRPPMAAATAPPRIWSDTHRKGETTLLWTKNHLRAIITRKYIYIIYIQISKHTNNQ